MIEIEDFEYAGLEIMAQKLNIDIETLVNNYISSISLLSHAHNKPKGQDLFKNLTEMMDTFDIKQSDIAQYLGLSQASVSLAIQKKSFSSALGKELINIGVDKFLINVYTHIKNRQANDAIDLSRKYVGDFTKDDAQNMDEIIVYVNKNHEEWSDITSIIFSHVYSQSKLLGADAKSCTFHAFAVIKKMTNEDKSYILNAAKASFPEFCDAIHKIIPKFDR